MRKAGPSLGELFPRIFSRSSPLVEGSSPLVLAGSLLRFHPVEAAMVLTERAQPVRRDSRVAFLGGYSILANLLKVEPARSLKFLFEPCRRNAMILDTVKVDQDLPSLLRLFGETRFGFTTITHGRYFALLGLSDTISLYEQGAIGTGLLAREVASKPVTTGKDTTLRGALRLMFERRIRRLFLKGGDLFVSDREIISYLFSPRKLEATRDAPRTMLNDRMTEAGPISAERIRGDAPLKDASKVLSGTQGSVLMCEGGIISPWDLVMKPFLKGRLAISD